MRVRLIKEFASADRSRPGIPASCSYSIGGETAFTIRRAAVTQAEKPPGW